LRPKLLTRSGHYPVEEVAELLAKLKACGDYDRTSAEAVSSSVGRPESSPTTLAQSPRRVAGFELYPRSRSCDFDPSDR
jgi:hypothetical protein